MAWVTWRQHRAALVGLTVFLGAFAIYLWITGLQMHHSYASACQAASTLACGVNFTGRYAQPRLSLASFCRRYRR
jgi:hypothetical protein